MRGPGIASPRIGPDAAALAPPAPFLLPYAPDGRGEVPAVAERGALSRPSGFLVAAGFVERFPGRPGLERIDWSSGRSGELERALDRLEQWRERQW